MMELNWEGVPARHPQPGVTTRRQDFANMTVVFYEFLPGAIFPLHSHQEEQLVVMLQGSCSFTVGDAVLALAAGASVIAAPYAAHGCKAGPDGCRFLNILSPRREGDGAIQFRR